MHRADYPLLFSPIYKEKVWGGRTLEKLGRSLPGDRHKLIGESWELVDLASTSASGGGGGAERSKIDNGALAGQTLHSVIQREHQAVRGHLPLSDSGGFPVLLKYLDARQNLSVQVHPSPGYAAQHEDAFLKSEAWYIVDAAPGSVIYKGIKPGVTPEQLREALKTNTDEAVVPLMIEVPVKPGDCHYLPSGTCHALGAGLLVAEVQTPSDTTYRVYDWGRKGRELHIEQAIACITFGPPEVGQYEINRVLSESPAKMTRRVVCEFFRIDELKAPAGYEDRIGGPEPSAVMVLAGQVVITPASGETTTMKAGDSALLPAAMKEATLRADSDTTLLHVTFPQAENKQFA
jgi:mannose-6-phosphate isomerase